MRQPEPLALLVALAVPFRINVPGPWDGRFVLDVPEGDPAETLSAKLELVISHELDQLLVVPRVRLEFSFERAGLIGRELLNFVQYRLAVFLPCLAFGRPLVHQFAHGRLSRGNL